MGLAGPPVPGVTGGSTTSCKERGKNSGELHGTPARAKVLSPPCPQLAVFYLHHVTP